MSDAWDGRPQNPARDGWHWLHHPEDLRPVVQPWSAEHGAWISGAMHSPQGVVDLGFYYIGPCLTPDEVAAREAAAAANERDACAQIAEDEAKVCEPFEMSDGWASAMTIRDAIRARGKETNNE